MAWNDNNNNQNPWGDNNQTPPELDEVIKDFKNKFNGMFGSSKSSDSSSTPEAPKGSIKFIAIVGVLIWMLSGIYIIDPAEKGVVKRFGAFQEETGQGPHWHIPFPIETLSRVNVSQIRTAEIGYRNVAQVSRPYFSTEHF